MALFKPYKITSDKLADLSVREGQIIITTDTKKLYVDVSATERIEITNDAEVDLSDYVTTTMLSSAIGEEASERQQQDNLLDDKIDTKLDTAQADNRYALKDNPRLTGNVDISNEDWQNGKITAAHSNGETEDYYKYVIGFDSLHRPYIAKKEGDNNVSMIYLDTNSIVFNKPLSFTGSSGIESNPKAASQTRQNIGAAAINHTHDDRYYTESEVNSKLADKANATHTHTIANVTNLQETIDSLEADIAGKAPTSHTHTTAQVSGLDTALAGKAPTNHNHNGVYSPVNHTHDQGVAYAEEKSTAGERYVKIMDYLCDILYCRVNQQFILASRQGAILLTVQITTINSKKIIYKDLTYLPLSQGYNDIISNLFAGIITVSAEQDRFELWYKQSQWSSSINIIPLGKNYDGARLNLFSYDHKVAGETKLPTFATQITLKRQTHSISEITDIANANTNSAKFIRDSQDNHTISLSYAEPDINTAKFLPVFKDRNTIGNMKLTTLRGAIDAAPARHNHDAANITFGVLNVDRIPSIPATKLTGIINQANLPSYVDDVLEFANKTAFPTKGESGKIYVDQATNKTYRWSGSGYVEISASLALGTTSSTAFRGDYGNVAYTHATAKGAAFGSGLYKITTNAQGHVTTATAVTKSDITALGIPGSDTNTNTTYELTKSGSTITLEGSDGSSTSVTDSNTVYTHPITPGNKHIPAGGSSGQILRWSADGTAAWGADNNTNTTYTLSKSGSTIKLTGSDGSSTTVTDSNTTYSAMTGATSSAAGSTGLVPAPAAGAATRYLRSDGTWQVPPDTNTTYTLSSFGITATAAELNKLDGVTATATELNYVDGVTSNIQTQLNGKAASSHTHSNYLTTSGTAAAATKLATACTFSLTGDVTGSASFNGTTNCSIAATLAANSVTANEIATGAVGLSELSSTVGTIAVQSATPTDSHVKLWIKV